jgi:hypothetical protein
MCVIPGGQNISRKFLIDMLDSAPVKVAWHVLYDINNDLYVINLEVAVMTKRMPDGSERKVPIRQ